MDRVWKLSNSFGKQKPFTFFFNRKINVCFVSYRFSTNNERFFHFSEMLTNLREVFDVLKSHGIGFVKII